MAFLRSIATASVLPAAGLAFVALSSSSSHPSKLQFPIPPFSSLSSKHSPHHLFSSSLSRTFAPPPQSAIRMDSSPPTDQKNEFLPQLLSEFMVDMKCDGCVSAVKNKLQALSGIERVDVDLSSQVVRVLGSLPVKTMVDALEQTGRTARLIGQGSPEDFLVSAAVAEFKGPVIFGVVRLAQVSTELARIEASFSGLLPGKHGWSINEFGDLTRGAASTGKVFNPHEAASEEPLGDLGTLDVHESGEAFYTGSKKMSRIADLIGRSIVVYETEDKSDQGIAAAVIARSAGVGENYKKLCTCDGVTIWESGKNDFAATKA